MLTHVRTETVLEKLPRRRVWVPLSVRAIAALLLILGVWGAGLIGLQVRRQRAALREFERLGATVEMRQFGPEWLGYLGITQTVPVITSVDFRGTAVSDADLACLEGLVTLQRIYLDGTQVTDAGLAHLAGLTDLESLWINETRITDAGLAHLRELDRLTEVALNDTQVTD